MAKVKTYACPYCNYRSDRERLITHINRKHEEMIPEGYTARRVVFNYINKKDHGNCVICRKPTEWIEDAGHYDRFCSDECREIARKQYLENIQRVRHTNNLMNDPKFQKKLLASRRISGTYKFRDGGIRSYTGSYEKNLLEFADKCLNIESKHIMTPGPTLEYSYNGEKHKWIIDQYWIPWNLLIEVKDGGNNPNKREMPEYRTKQICKEVMITDSGEYNYIRLTNNEFPQLIELLMEIKKENMTEDPKPIVKIYENAIMSSLNEGYLFSKNNLYINFDKFESGESNVCLVTGLSGSGKSTLGTKIAKEYNAECIELDIFEHSYGFNDDELREAGEVFYEYFSDKAELREKLRTKSIKGKELGVEIKKFFNYCMGWTNSHKDTRFVIEGVQIYSFADPNKMKKYPIIFVNAPMVKSILQRWKRNGDGKIELWKELKDEFPQMLAWYIDNEKSFDKFQKAVLSESVITEMNHHLREPFIDPRNQHGVYFDAKSYEYASGVTGVEKNWMLNKNPKKDPNNQHGVYFFAYSIGSYVDDENIDGFAISNDILPNKILRVNRDGKLIVESAEYLNDKKVSIFRYIGDKSIRDILTTETVGENYLYEALTGKKMFIKEQAVLDYENFELLDLNRLKSMKESYEATMWLDFNQGANKQFYFPMMSATDIYVEGLLTNGYNDIAILEDIDGYFVYNKFLNQRSKSYSSITEIGTDLVKQIAFTNIRGSVYNACTEFLFDNITG